jgi:hypothetical protein
MVHALDEVHETAFGWNGVIEMMNTFARFAHLRQDLAHRICGKHDSDDSVPETPLQSTC